jgi:hypothetical protein
MAQPGIKGERIVGSDEMPGWFGYVHWSLREHRQLPEQS